MYKKLGLLPWLYVAPVVVILGVYLVYPVLSTAYLSFFNADSTRFVGLENYIYLFTHQDTLIAFKNNLLWLIFFTSFTVSLGLLIAVLADKVRYESAAKSIIFLPMAISGVAAGTIWKFMLDFNPRIGLLNAIVKGVLHARPIAWLQRYPINTFALITVGIWMWTGFSMVILSAAIKNIPRDILEAAEVDGATEWQKFWHITIPMVSTTIVVLTTTLVINVLKVFDIVYVMTGGNYGTDVIANRMFKLFYVENQFGRSAAIAVVLLLLITPVMAINAKWFRE